MLTHVADDLGDPVGGDAKRIKGLGNGGASGPIMLNDVRQLQRSNEVRSVLFVAQPIDLPFCTTHCTVSGLHNAYTI